MGFYKRQLAAYMAEAEPQIADIEERIARLWEAYEKAGDTQRNKIISEINILRVRLINLRDPMRFRKDVEIKHKTV